jgi:hypothetical protein
LEEIDHLDYDFEKYLNSDDDNDVQACVDFKDEEIVNFCMEKISEEEEIEEELVLSIENEPKKRYRSKISL